VDHLSNDPVLSVNTGDQQAQFRKGEIMSVQPSENKNDVIDGWKLFEQDMLDHGWMEDAREAVDQGEFPTTCPSCNNEYNDHLLMIGDGAMACFAVCWTCDRAEEYITV
jgi:hypothetical protein